MDHLVSRRNFLTTGIATAAWALAPAFGETQDLTALALKKASELLRSKAASPVDLTQACLKRIEKYNPAVNAFITVTGESALAAAREMEAEQRRGKWRGPLHGVPNRFEGQHRHSRRPHDGGQRTVQRPCSHGRCGSSSKTEKRRRHYPGQAEHA